MNVLKKVLNFWPAGALAASILFAVVGRLDFALFFFVGFLGLAALKAFKNQPSQATKSPLDAVSNNNRVRLRPLTQLASEIDALIREHRDKSIVQTMGAEVQREAAAILEHSVELINLRERQTDVLNSSTVQETLRHDHDDDSSAAVRNAARQAQENIDRIDATLEQAKTVLSSLRTRLAQSATGDQDMVMDGMREAMLNTKALGATFDETEAFLKGEA